METELGFTPRDGVVLHRGTSARSSTPKTGGFRSTTPEPGERVVIPAKAGIQIVATVLLIAALVTPSFAARIGPPIDDETPAFRISANESTLLALPFRFSPAEGPSHPPRFLRGARAAGACFLASEWSIALPDRDDGFSVRWLGYWAPGGTECEIRLQADESATFYLDGKKALECVEGATRSTGTFSLDSRVHQLRVDYAERTGEAFVRLEWKQGDSRWKPLVASVDRKKESAAGWNADYYLGENFETKSFSRVDPSIRFDWGARGPFDRLEDVPTLTWRILNDDEDWTGGEVSANRDGTLALGLVLAATREGRNASLSFSNPLLQFSGGENDETVSIQFDREASDFSIGAATEGKRTTESGRLEFSLRAGDTIRFWETGGALTTGAQVANVLERAAREYEETRPRISGEWEGWDETIFRTGAWRLQVLADRASFPKGKAFDRLARLAAPDLAPGEGAGSEDPDPFEEMAEALEGLKSVETRISENPDGGLDLHFAGPLEGDYRFDNRPLGNDRLDIQGGAKGIRIEDGVGFFLSFDRPGTVTGFRIDEAGNWTGVADLQGPATLRASPADRVVGILWNGIPLLLVREGDRFSARLPDARGSFRVLSKKE